MESIKSDLERGDQKRKNRKETSRGTWTGRLDFLLSCVGFAVGLGNVWRFPALCYKSGGGAFLIPYTLFLVLCGIPLFYLELAFGQFASLGPVSVWRISPLFQGLGYGMVAISTIVCIYYNVIMAWTIYYAYLSVNLSLSLPWASCDNDWATENCVDGIRTENVTYTANTTSSSQEFWIRYVLKLSSGIDDMGEVRIELLISLFLAWVIVFCCLCKGVKSSGRVVYFSATFPYLVLFILLIRGVTLPGAMDGIKFYLSPQWDRLKDIKVWGAAATQIFYSVGPAWGGILTMASYNKFHHNCYRDAMVVPLINCATSIFAGFVVFSVIGFMAQETGQPIDKVVSQGPGLAFIVYPEAVSRFPGAWFWAFLFFAMLFTIGLDSQFGMFECVISSFVDEFPRLRPHKVLFTMLMCCVLFLLGIPCVTQGGMYVLHLMDSYSATFSLMIVSFCEAVVIAWVYGVDRFCEDIYLMIRIRPGIWWRLCWKYITPTVIAFLLVFTILSYETITYNDYVYPDWAVGLGWEMAVCSMIPIPLVALICLFRAKGSLKERVLTCLRPSDSWGPALQDNRDLYKESIADVPSKFTQMSVTPLDPTTLQKIHSPPKNSPTSPAAQLPTSMTGTALLEQDCIDEEEDQA
ncbi:unnamed protein product [Cyprideis torosa]|uniref:Transporter n=1 Tax=Cyprideis torosa TaxID=163714 RepID=A0A7R8ZSJ1_9CRUS|nr:unnamed protein product [Cyprideis torosa]CAG0895647.1 unnamed protein product [Cyprideis torosa]